MEYEGLQAQPQQVPCDMSSNGRVTTVGNQHRTTCTDSVVSSMCSYPLRGRPIDQSGMASFWDGRAAADKVHEASTCLLLCADDEPRCLGQPLHIGKLRQSHEEKQASQVPGARIRITPVHSSILHYRQNAAQFQPPLLAPSGC